MNEDISTSKERIRRIGGNLHSIRELHDQTGKVLGVVTKQLKVEFRLQDVIEIVVGGCVMAIPIALTEEVWILGSELSWGRIVGVAIASVVTLALFVWALFYRGRVGEYRLEFLKRTSASYTITLLTSFGLLLLFDRVPVAEDFAVTIKRTIIVAYPACFAATAVDYIK